MPERVRIEAHFSGHVQGVGFRFTAFDIADRFSGIAGFVRNLADGRVEVVAEGPEDQVNEFFAAIEDAMRSHIRSVDKKQLPAAGEFPSFTIAR
jgi:acylphosphatase